MSDYRSISKQQPSFPAYLDFDRLRQIGIEHLQALSGNVWTDYNLHDPGITILEVLCYAITDLGYRINLDIQDLLAQEKAQPDTNFFTPDQILTCNPVTPLDLRKRLLDIPGVRNAWMRRFHDYYLTRKADSHEWDLALPHRPNANPSPTNASAYRLNLKGLYTVLLDLDPPLQRDACGQPYTSIGDILKEVNAVLHSYRNLCEDVHNVVVLGEEHIGLRGSIELSADVDAHAVLSDIFVQIQNFLAPHIQFYTLQELLDRGKDPAEIFAGRPSAIAHHDSELPSNITGSHGFIDTAELEALTLPTQLHTSDLYQIILNTPGVLTVNDLSIRSYINGLPQTQEQRWALDLAPNYRPVLGIDQSHLSLSKGGIPVVIDNVRVKRRYAQHRLTNLKTQRNNSELDLSVPQGTHYDTLAKHYSIHHDFPLAYGIGEEGLPATASAERHAQAKQLQGYLIFFDQLFANYLMQLAHVRDLFSWESTKPRTYFTQLLDFPGYNEHFKDHLDLNLDFLQEIIESPVLATERRNRFLDHLLARFAESFTDYVLLNYRLHDRHANGSVQSGQHDNANENNSDSSLQTQQDILSDKAHFLENYPLLSRDRFRAANYACPEGWHSNHISGYERRISHLLGISNTQRRSLLHYDVVHHSGAFTLRLGCAPGERERDRPLLSLHPSTSLSAAQDHLDTLLDCALNPDCYHRLVYRNAYHSLEVVEEDGTSLVFYDHSYPTAAARDTALPLLIEQVRITLLQTLLKQLQQLNTVDVSSLLHALEPATVFVTATIPILLQNLENSFLSALESLLHLQNLSQLPPSVASQLQTLKTLAIDALRTQSSALFEDNLEDKLIELDEPTQGSEHGFGFTLHLSPTHPQLRFVSAQRYSERDMAYEAAVKALMQIPWPQFYHPISLHSQDVDPSTTVDGKLSTYGFSLVDAAGTPLATLDSAFGFNHAHSRDAMMYALQTSQSSIQIEADGTGWRFTFYIFELNDPLGRRMLLRSTKRYSNELALQQAIQELSHCLRLLRCYQIAWDPDDGSRSRYQLRIMNGRSEDEAQVLAASELLHPTSDNEAGDRLAAFAWVNAISPYLWIEWNAASDNYGGYRFRILDRRGNTLLLGSRLHSSETVARDHVYRDVLAILWEPGAIAPTQPDNQHSFVISHPSTPELDVLAYHPGQYPTEAERDQAIHRLKVLLRTANLNILLQQSLPGYIGQVYQPPATNATHGMLVQGTRRFTYELARMQSWYTPEMDLTSAIQQAVQGASEVAGDRLHVAIDYLSEGRPENPTEQSGYQFTIFPTIATDDRSWRFTSSRLYDTYEEAQHEGSRAKQLLRTSSATDIFPPSDSVRDLQALPEAQFLYSLQRQQTHLEHTLILLDKTHQKLAEQKAWDHGDTLIRLAEEEDCFRRIDPQPSTFAPPSSTTTEATDSTAQRLDYGWVLSGMAHYSTLAIPHPPYYPQASDRDRAIQQLQDYINDEGLHTLEHILLRPRQAMIDSYTYSKKDEPKCFPLVLPSLSEPISQSDRPSTLRDPYSFWMSVVLPAWPKRFQDTAFRNFVERTLRLEAPAHVALKIAWVNVRQMHEFEDAYQLWFEQLSLATREGESCHQTCALNDLIKILSSLKSVYPVAILSGADLPIANQNPIVLDQTPLGSINEEGYD